MSEKTEKEEIVPYRCVPRWVVPTVGSVAATSGLILLLLPFPLTAIICPALITSKAAFIVAETTLRMLSLLYMVLVSFFTYELARNENIVLTATGITFPFLLAPDLLFNRKRSWDDVANVLVGCMLLEDKHGQYEYELEEAKDKRRLFVYFTSGGHVAIDLTRIPKENDEALFRAFESRCYTFSRAPIARSSSSARSWDEKNDTQEPIKIGHASYTQMWEDELHLHFSATNFVPLEKEATLQDGKYMVLMQLSTGGLSAVYLAELPNKALVVLKEAVLPHGLADRASSKARELFHREAAILRKLEHPRIAKVLDCFVERGRDYMVLDFVPGESLRQVVRRRGTQSERSVLKYALQAANILSYLHSLTPPVVHRDLTPDNMIAKENEQLILIDFGAANQFVGVATGTLIGKQCYIAPEQFRGKATVQSDYYSLGCTLAFLLTGEDPEALSTSHPRLVRADISDELDQLVADLTALDPKTRLQTAGEIIDRVRALLPDTALSLSGLDGR